MTTTEDYTCAYCGRTIDGPEPEVPASDDDAAWERLAEEHSEGCEWVETRAHRVDSRSRSG